MNYIDFGRRVKHLRKERHITQEELAAALGVTAAAVSKWENNYTLPDVLMLGALADFFSVTTSLAVRRMLTRIRASSSLKEKGFVT